MHNPEIRLFVGDPVTDTAELSLINRLRSDLARHGIGATLYANFFTEARQSLQIDLLVRTEIRTAHVEIKGFRTEYPIRGCRNGMWAQILPGGEERPLGKNCGRQALSGTYAISDAMRDLAQAGVVASADGGFPRHIDSIVGIWERVPSGSDINPPPHVTVMGYSELLERLRQPGPVVPWTENEWDEFARHHSLFQLEDTTPAEARRRDAQAIIDDYRLRSRSSLASGLSSLVSLEATGPDASSSDAGGIGRRIADGHAAAIVGQSGSGKSFLARHLAVSDCDEGRMVIWIRASDYTMGEFGALLARAVGPFSVERRSDLVDAASDAGVPLTVIVDGLNECPADERAELLRQLQAFTLRHPAGVLITSTTDEGLDGTIPLAVFRLHEPDESTRVAILSSHGARRPESISDQLRIPHDLAIAALCASELGDNATVADLHDAFIRRHAPTEAIRAGLRTLASHLQATLRSSAPQIEAVKILNAAQPGLSADQIDAVFGTPLLDVSGHRVRFRHDLFAQHLAAEALVIAAESGQSLGAALSPPANRVLIPAALGIAQDGAHTWAALCELAAPSHVAASLHGTYGPETAQRAADSIRDVLRAGIAAAATGNAAIDGTEPGTLEGVEVGCGRWVTSDRWSDSDQMLLAAAGLALDMFAVEACELIDLTDKLCQIQASRLEAEGISDTAEAVVHPTYSQFAHIIGGEGLAGTGLVRAAREASWRAPRTSVGASRGLAQQFAEGAGPQSWGRYFLAVLAINPNDPDDQALAATLLQRAWDAGGHDLQTEALDMVKRLRWYADIGEANRAAIGEVLQSLDPGRYLAVHMGLDDALSAFGRIENGIDADTLRDEVRAEISGPLDGETARRIASRQFENQDVFGPYWEAIDGLTSGEQARLLIAAATGDTQNTCFFDQMIGQLAACVPTGDPAIDEDAKAIFAAYLNSPNEDAFMGHEVAGIFRFAIRGWAEFESSLPPPPSDLASTHRCWHHIAGLQLRYEREDAQVDVEGIWEALLADPGRAFATLAHIEVGDSKHEFNEEGELVGRRTLLDRLVSDYPSPMRQLCEWVLTDPTRLGSNGFKQRESILLAIRTLGRIGDTAAIAKLDTYILDPEIGGDAVESIRQINNRGAP